MRDLDGLRVALLEGRMPDALADLVRRRGGEPHCVPALREEPLASADAVRELLDRAAGEDHLVVVLSTGVGVATLFAEACALGREGDLRNLLDGATTVCRGPKPVAALQREGLAASVRVAPPYTSGEIIDALRGLDLAGRLAVIVHYGERNPLLVDELTRGGARVHELLLYAWRLPVDLEPLRRLVAEICRGEWGAVLFTSQAQARHLFQVARSMDRDAALREALRTRTIVVAVGPTCAAVLASVGVEPQVVPDNPKMGAMIAALAAYVSRARRPERSP